MYCWNCHNLLVATIPQQPNSGPVHVTCSRCGSIFGIAVVEISGPRPRVITDEDNRR